MKTKRAALVYSGQPRHLKECYANHVATFHEANPGWEFDVFAHIWHDDQWIDPDYARSASSELDARKIERRWRTTEVKGSHAFESDIKNFITENWKPKKIVFEKPRDFVDEGLERHLGFAPSGHRDEHKNNPISMFYSIERANNLKREYEKNGGFKYDCVIRLRTDCYFVDPLGPLGECDMRKLNVTVFDVPPRHHPPDIFAFYMQDIFALGGSAVMDKYSAVFSNIKACYENASFDCRYLFQGHYLLGFHVRVHQKLEVAEHPWIGHLWRFRFFGHFDSVRRFDFCMAFMKTHLGDHVAAAHESAARLVAGAACSMVRLEDFSSFYRLYINTIPEPRMLGLRYFQKALKSGIDFLEYKPGDKVRAIFIFNFYRYKLQALIKKAMR